MIRNCITIALIMLLSAGGCRKTESESGQSSKDSNETARKVIAYSFLLAKMQEDGIDSIASENDEDVSMIKELVRTEGLKLAVENYSDIEKGRDLCYYSKSTKKMVAIIDVTSRSENRYYVSYYLGPEGGASREVLIEKSNGGWTVADDDRMWNVK